MRIGLNITDYSGKWEKLSKETYEIITLDGTIHIKDADYAVGSRVKLISGVDDSSVCGYHFRKGWITVCRENAFTAEFLGLPKKNLKLISK